MIEQFKAIMIFGGPGSGKDMVLRSTILSEEGFVEVDLNKLHKAVLDNQDIMEVNEGKALIINGNADDQKKVILVRSVLEAVGYDVMGLYVYTSNEVSRERNEQRIKTGAKTITESVRQEKWTKSLDTARAVAEDFKKFEIFNNSSSTLTEEVRGWLVELNTILIEHFEVVTDLDKAVDAFLAEEREPRGEFHANQALARTVQQNKTRSSSSDYFSHNAKQQSKRDIRDPKITKPAASHKTGPSDTTSTNPGRNIYENLPSFKSLRPNLITKAKQLKRPDKIDTIRPQDSIGGGVPSQGQNGSPSLGGDLVGEGKLKIGKVTKKTAKPPQNDADSRAGDGMAGVSTFAEAVKNKKKTCPPVNQGDSRVTPVDGATQVLSREEVRFSNLRNKLQNKSSDSECNSSEVFEDWGIDGDTSLFEGRVVKTNKPFKLSKAEYGVYIKDGDTISMLKFARKNAVTINENVGPTDVRFWETL